MHKEADMEDFSAPAQITDGIRVNQMILEYMLANGAKRLAEVDAFVHAPNRTDVLIMEVFKGLIASRKV